VKVNDDETPQGLFRGDEPLDEQDFYHLTGDVESESAVKGRAPLAPRCARHRPGVAEHD